MILSTLKKYFNRRNLLFVWLFVWIYFIFSDVALAETTTPAAQPTDTNKLITTLHGAMQIVGALLGTVTALVTLLLNPGWYNGEIFNLQKYFKEVWILVSNVVYFIFAFVLIWIAFMNIIGKQGENYEIKKALPKLFIGILMVPFSWFMVQFIVSLSNILMVGILSLPFDTFKDFTEMKNISGTICTKFEIDVWWAPNANSNTASASPNNPTEWYKCDEWSRKEIKDLIQKPESVFNIISIYTYGILRLDQLNKATLDSIKWVKTLGGLAVKVVFDMVFILVYAILMLAIFIALFMRGVWIWMYMMLSPLFGLMYFFDKHEWVGEFGHFNIKEFIKLAMVPVYVGWALSFGILFIFVTSKGFEIGDGKGTGWDKLIKCEWTPPTCTITVFEFSFAIKWAGAAATGINEASNFTKSALGGIILNLFGIAVLWIAVMAALNSSEITKSIVEPIAWFGKSIGETVMKAPQYMPLLPGPGGGWLSASALSKVGSSVRDIPSSFVNQQAKPWEQAIDRFKWKESLWGEDRDAAARALRDAQSSKTPEDFKRANDTLMKIYNRLWTDWREQQELLVDYARSIGKSRFWMTDEQVKAITKETLFDGSGKLTQQWVSFLRTATNESRLKDFADWTSFRDKLREPWNNSTVDTSAPVTQNINVQWKITSGQADSSISINNAGTTINLALSKLDKPREIEVTNAWSIWSLKQQFTESDFRTKILLAGWVESWDAQTAVIKSITKQIPDFFKK